MNVWQPQRNTWASPGSVTRNKRPIAEALTAFLNKETRRPKNVLEIASGFGDHVGEFANDHQDIQFFPSEAQEECLEAIRQLQVTNVSSPYKLNVLDKRDWQNIRENGPEEFDGIININMIHISPPESTETLFDQASRVLREGGFVLLYGAYLREDGTFASDGDRDFDGSLRLRDASFGLRNPLEVDAIARRHGFHRIEALTMALNNRLFIWRLVKTP